MFVKVHILSADLVILEAPHRLEGTPGPPGPAGYFGRYIVEWTQKNKRGDPCIFFDVTYIHSSLV